MTNNPFILLSVINTALRDKYSSLNDYCLSEDESKSEILDILSNAGYFYDEELNCFRQK